MTAIDHLTSQIDPQKILTTASEVVGNCPGVYFLYDGENLVYIGQSWNCFLGVAENTRKESSKVFTRWSFVHVESEDERKHLVRELKKRYPTIYNKS